MFLLKANFHILQPPSSPKFIRPVPKRQLRPLRSQEASKRVSKTRFQLKGHRRPPPKKGHPKSKAYQPPTQHQEARPRPKKDQGPCKDNLRFFPPLNKQLTRRVKRRTLFSGHHLPQQQPPHRAKSNPIPRDHKGPKWVSIQVPNTKELPRQRCDHAPHEGTDRLNSGRNGKTNKFFPNSRCRPLSSKASLRVEGFCSVAPIS